MFQSLKKIQFYISEVDKDDCTDEDRKEWEREFRWAHWVCRYLNTTHGLRCLELHVNDKSLFQILSKINSLERVLNRLKSFNIHLSWHGAYDQASILQGFSRYQTALKYLTRLTMGLIITRESFQVLELLPSSCPQLIYLQFSTSSREIIQDFEDPSKFYYSIDIKKANFLESFKDFKALQKLEIASYCGLKFLRKCQFPASLLHLSLKFYNFWCKEKDFSLQVGLERLEKLETLNIELLTRWDQSVELVPEDETEEFLQEKDNRKKRFLQGFLSRIVSPLKKLSLTLSRSYFPDKSGETPRSQGDFNLTDFFRSIEHLRGSFTSLHIVDKWSEYRLCLRDDQICHFSNLSNLSIKSDISPFTDFDRILEVMQLKNEQLKPCMKLNGIRLNSCEALLNFFCRLGQIKGTNGRYLKLHIYLQDMDNDIQYLEKNHAQVMKKIGRLKNIFLKITAIKSEFWEKDETAELLCLFGGVRFYMVCPP